MHKLMSVASPPSIFFEGRAPGGERPEDDGAFHCPSCREPILPCFPINKNRGLMAALRLNERLARRRR